MYTTIPGPLCVKLLTKDGYVGCDTGSSRVTGKLRLVDSFARLDEVATASDRRDHKLAIVLQHNLFISSVIDRLAASLPLAGVLVLPTPGSAARNLSHAPADAWNTNGDGMIAKSYPFAMVLLEDQDLADDLIARANANEGNLEDDQYMSHTVEFEVRMYGEHNSATCLKENQCLPVGGHNVWATIDDGIRRNDSVTQSKRIVMAVTGFTGLAMFHDRVLAADSATSGTIAQLAAMQALASNTRVNGTALPKRIVFAWLTAEAFGKIGSRKFVRDLSSFTCGSYDDPARQSECQCPFALDPEFQRLSLDRLDAVLEVNQVGKTSANGGNLYFYTPSSPSSSAATEVRNALNAVASNITSFSLQAASSLPTPTLPPSSSAATFRNATDAAGLDPLPTFVLTDHNGEYTNERFQSRYDSADNIDTNVPATGSSDPCALCDVATLLARTLYDIAGGTDPAVRNSIESDRDTVRSLVDCLLNDAGCDLAQQVSGGAAPSRGSRPNHYSSVFVPRERDLVSGTSRFIYDYVSSLLPEVVATSTTESTKKTVFYHEAHDPGLSFDCDSKRWSVADSSQSELYTESNWITLRVRAFQTENPTVEAAMLGLGIGLTVLTVPIMKFLNQYCSRHFKVL